MFHEGRDLVSLFGEFGTPSNFPNNFLGFAGTGRSLLGKPRPSRQVINSVSVPSSSSGSKIAGAKRFSRGINPNAFAGAFAGAFPGDPGGD